MNSKAKFSKDGDPLISRELLFSNPDYLLPQISNDGKILSYIAPYNGILNIWVSSVSFLQNSRPITHDIERGIREYFWAKDNNHIIFIQDNQGDENWYLNSININTGVVTVLTPPGIRASILKTSMKFPDNILVTMNDRDSQYFDVYRVNIESGTRTLIHKNTTNYTKFIADDNFDIRIALKISTSGIGKLYLIDKNDARKTLLLKTIPIDDMLNTYPLHLSSDGTTLFMLDSTNRNTSALIEIDLNRLTSNEIYTHSKVDIIDYLVNSKNQCIECVAIEYFRKTWIVFNQKLENHVNHLCSLKKGDVEVISRSYEDMKWVVAFVISNGPIKYYLYDTKLQKLEFLSTSHSNYEKLRFSNMSPVCIKSRDNLDLVSYLTIPRWLDDGHGKPMQPIPLILSVHGGPNARDRWKFSTFNQWLANRGYAVLNVNYRGSTGFGKDFINAGNGEWARKMQDDLIDAVNWAIKNNIAERKKIVIMGGSYGGYATLVGMTMTPEIFAAGVDIVGPSNLETLIHSIPPYWKPHIAHIAKMIGALPNTDLGKKFLKSRSPLTYVKNIKNPLLVVQGANDPRVKQVESDQIVDYMKLLKIPVIYLLYPDEGHGLVRPENKLSMCAVIEKFLFNVLGGRYMAYDPKFIGSSIQIKEGRCQIIE